MEIALGDRVNVPGDEQEQWRCPACDEATPAHADAPASAEPVALEAAPLLSTPSEPDSVDECEVLLRRAIEMVRGVPPRGQAAPGAADASPAAAGLHCTAPESILPETDSGLDECEALLGRAIEMVRGPIDRVPPRRGIADDWPKAPGDPVKPIRAPRSATGRVVRIDHDPREAAYVARDIGSGLSVLRHQDGVRLRAMCERIGWQVADGGPPVSAD